MLRWLRRRRLLKRRFPEEWEPILKERLSFSSTLEGEEAARFRIRLKLFVWEKHWIGAKDLVVTDEMQVIIAGAAARLARNLPLDVYDRLTEIVIYPSHYRHPQSNAIVFGEAHHWGTVVFSWDAVRCGIANPFDGHDTALHEFAHVLDVSDGAFDGTPVLSSEDYQAWINVFSRHFLAMRKRPGKSVLRSYGATNEAEFFAVATETFFEKPEQLEKRAPDLYRELKKYYAVDPASALRKRRAVQGCD